MRIEFLAQARRELARAAIWYDRRATGLGDGLLGAVGIGLHEIRDFPLAHPPIDAVYRRKLIDRFPYAIIYRIEADVIRIVAIAHTSRRPNYWRRNS